MDTLERLLNMICRILILILVSSFSMLYADSPWAGEWILKPDNQSAELKDADKGFNEGAGYYSSGRHAFLLGADRAVIEAKESISFSKLEVLFQDSEKWILILTSSDNASKAVLRYYPEKQLIIADGWLSGERFAVRYSRKTQAEVSTDQPATTPEPKSEGNEKLKLESKERSQ